MISVERYTDNEAIKLQNYEALELVNYSKKYNKKLLIKRTQDLYYLYPNGFVGIIKTPDRTIIINPRHKIFNFDVILHMWHYITFGNLEVPIIEIGATTDNFSDYIITIFLNELNKLTNLRGKYIEFNENLSYFKGRIMIEDHLKRNLNFFPKFFCQFEEYTLNNPMNQLLNLALKKINRKSMSSKDLSLFTKMKLRFSFANSNKKNFSKYAIDMIIAEAKSSVLDKHYTFALSLGKIILLDLREREYGTGGFTEIFLVNYDLLFQKFISKILKTFYGTKILTEPIINYAEWREPNGTPHMKWIKPDLLYEFDNESKTCATILDTKNKYYEKLSDYFNSSDIYEMYFYAKKLNSSKIILIYPTDHSQDNLKLTKILYENEDVLIYAVFINLVHIFSKEFYEEIIEFYKNINEII